MNMTQQSAIWCEVMSLIRCWKVCSCINDDTHTSTFD